MCNDKSWMVKCRKRSGRIFLLQTAIIRHKRETHELHVCFGVKPFTLTGSQRCVLKYDSSVVTKLRVGDQEGLLGADDEVEANDELDFVEIGRSSRCTPANGRLMEVEELGGVARGG